MLLYTHIYYLLLGCLCKSVVLFPLVDLELIFSGGYGVYRELSKLVLFLCHQFPWVYLIKCFYKMQSFITSSNILILIYVSGPASRFRPIPRDTRGHKSQSRHGLFKIRDIHIIKIFLVLCLRCSSCWRNWNWLTPLLRYGGLTVP